MKKLVILAICLAYQFIGYSQPTFDLRGIIAGNITTVVPTGFSEWACLTDLGELVYYFDDEYHIMSEGEVPILVQSMEHPWGVDSLLNLRDITFEKLFGGAGYIWAISERGLAVTFSTNGDNFSMPIVNLPNFRKGTPTIKVTTLPSTAPSDKPWFAGEFYDGTKIVGALTKGIDELDESYFIDDLLDTNRIDGFSNKYTFTESYFDHDRRCFIAWDNINKALMCIYLGDYNHIVVPYEELPIEVQHIQWIGAKGNVRVSGDPVFSFVPNAFLYLLNGKNKLYRYWLHGYPNSGANTPSGGYGPVRFQNYNEVSDDPVDDWAIWLEMNPGLVESNDQLEGPIQDFLKRHVYFGVKGKQKLLKYDQVNNDYCNLDLSDILESNLTGLSKTRFGLDLQSYAFSDKTITLLTDIEDRACGPISFSNHGSVQELDINVVRLNTQSVSVNWDSGYEFLAVYTMGGRLLERIETKNSPGQKLLYLEMNQSYIITAMKDGQLVGSKVFL